MPDLPAYVRNERLDILSANRLGEALYSELFAEPGRPVNMARFIFLNPRATEFYCDWETIANDAVAILRAKAGSDPYDRRLTDLIGELSTRSEEFHIRSAAHWSTARLALLGRLVCPSVAVARHAASAGRRRRRGDPAPAGQPQPPPCWPRAIRAVRAWLAPRIALQRWWQAWSKARPRPGSSRP